MATEKMRACLYSPYLPHHFGGGEKYMLDVAQELAKKYDVSIAVPVGSASEKDFPRYIKEYEAFLNTKLRGISFVTSPLGSNASLKDKVMWTKQFDLMYYLTDGSIFVSLAKKNILHIQVPYTNSKTSPLQRLKLFNWKVKNANSHFTKQVVEHHWRTHIPFVHYPLVELNSNQQAPKGKLILHIGRFFRNLHTKRQDVLVDIFRQLREQHSQTAKGWKLVFVGAVEDQSYLEEVKAKAKGLPIEFYHDVTRQDLEKWMARASIYWHATGFEVNAVEHPERVEHFGISTAEAMMAGCVPIVHGKGGQLEVLGEELRDWQWLSLEEAVSKTSQVMRDAKLRTQLQQRAQRRATAFGRQTFTQTLWKMVDQA